MLIIVRLADINIIWPKKIVFIYFEEFLVQILKFKTLWKVCQFLVTIFLLKYVGKNKRNNHLEFFSNLFDEDRKTIK
jgi:hypothetical protein